MSINDAYTDLLPISWKLLYFPARRRGIEIVYVLYLLMPGVMAVAGTTSVLWSANGGRTSIRRLAGADPCSHGHRRGGGVW